MRHGASRFLRLTNGGRVALSLIGAVGVHDARIFINGHQDNLLAVVDHDTAEEASTELTAITDQLDEWEGGPVTATVPAAQTSAPQKQRGGTGREV